LCQLTAFQQAPELEDHRFVRQGLYTGVESRKRAHQRHVVPRLFRSISSQGGSISPLLRHSGLSYCIGKRVWRFYPGVIATLMWRIGQTARAQTGKFFFRSSTGIRDLSGIKG
jgi:hypothetical protein